MRILFLITLFALSVSCSSEPESVIRKSPSPVTASPTIIVRASPTPTLQPSGTLGPNTPEKLSRYLKTEALREFSGFNLMCEGIEIILNRKDVLTAACFGSGEFNSNYSVMFARMNYTPETNQITSFMSMATDFGNTYGAYTISS